MKRVEVLTEQETGGERTYKVIARGWAVCAEAENRVVDTGKGITDLRVWTLTTALPIKSGQMIRLDGVLCRVSMIGRHGMAGLRRYQAVEEDTL